VTERPSLGLAAMPAEELAQMIREHRAALAEVERLRVVVTLARAASAARGNFNQHSATCQDSPCDVCEDLAELEHDAENELDMQLVELGKEASP